MDIKVKMAKGCFYRNEMWFSPAYQRLTIGARDLLQCLYTEIRKTKVNRKWKEFRNGELSFVESQYTKLTGRCKQTYIVSRNLLIEVGFVKMTHRGGTCRGDRAMYRVLFCDDVSPQHQRWRRYPSENWANEIPKSKGLTIGKKTQWKSGQTGRKVISHPNAIDSKE
tara:strand:+ start:925 stop:1425 length:501 start_codon:yes stop_codon:yes gene_type:complete